LLAGASGTGVYVDPISGVHSLDLTRVRRQHSLRRSERDAQAEPAQATGRAAYYTLAVSEKCNRRGSLDPTATGGVFTAGGPPALVGGKVPTHQLSVAEQTVQDALLSAGSNALRRLRAMQQDPSPGTAAPSKRGVSDSTQPAGTEDAGDAQSSEADDSTHDAPSPTPEERAVAAVAAGSAAVVQDTLRELTLALEDLEHEERIAGVPVPRAAELQHSRLVQSVRARQPRSGDSGVTAAWPAAHMSSPGVYAREGGAGTAAEESQAQPAWAYTGDWTHSATVPREVRSSTAAQQPLPAAPGSARARILQAAVTAGTHKVQFFTLD